jgi:hypothetical protein
VSLEEGFEAMAKERDQLLTHIALMYEFTYWEWKEWKEWKVTSSLRYTYITL